jgi:signal transduction histidine kinase
MDRVKNKIKTKHSENIIIEKHKILQDKIKESERIYEKIKIQNQQKSSIDFICKSLDMQKDLESLLDLEMLLLKEDQVRNWNEHFKSFAHGHNDIYHLALMNSSELLEYNPIEEDVLIFNLPFNDLFLIIKHKSNFVLDHAQSIELIVTMILRTIQIQDQQLIKSDGEIDFWKKIFSKIPYPMAVISNLGDLLIYNESFAKIGILPKECLRFKDQENLEIFHNFYKLRRIEFSIDLMNVSYFVFYTSETRESVDENKTLPHAESIKGGVGELGIISSSIAHELNNPLAGILAALSLLSLEDDWSLDEKNDLDDMKNGAKRCKELVEIFLGFSRFSPAVAQIPSIKDSVDQAHNLLRFRMIESNLRLDILYVPTLERFSHQINSSIMSMIFYLIFNELITAFAHERLITQFHVTTMNGEVLEFSDQIIMKLDYDFEYEEKIVQSKLIQHLLLFEKLKINFLKKEIRLIYRQ